MNLLSPFASVLRRAGEPLEPGLRQAKLPTLVLDEPGGFVVGVLTALGWCIAGRVSSQPACDIIATSFPFQLLIDPLGVSALEPIKVPKISEAGLVDPTDILDGTPLFHEVPDCRA